MKYFSLLLIITDTICATTVVQSSDLPYDCVYCQVEQIHISYGEKPNDIVITWNTKADTAESLVEYGVDEIDKRVEGWRVSFIDGRGQWVHRVQLTDLLYDTRYVYHCGSQYRWSEQLWFRTPPAGEDWVVRAAIFGDLGVDNARALPYIQNEAQRSKFDVIIHVGDFAYDMHEEDSRVGDQFMRQIQPLAATVPYMTCPGNHEENRNFSNYRNRFSMPLMNETDSLFYSWNLGSVHFIAINTEAYYFLNYGAAPLVNQYQWLEKDLKEATKPQNRRRRPWLVMLGHRPMYCSNSDDVDCGEEYTRRGIFGLEPLLKKFGVDLVIWAHEHSYERTWPLYDNVVYNGSYEHPYVNPRAPVHVITGSAGCKEGRDHFKNNPQSWSAFRSQDFGYTRLKAYNKTHINIEQVSVDLDGQVIDHFWLIKNKTLSFSMIISP
ncbi:acid phosphatase type 7-like isoform X2 [Hyposmocoma kahamanoa]|uniref:acid phosphatase type 7-like isoform X2 n=1 Tax=Hyposmocoma kahamanoa TaxID=1477025 RepID=UPI000E6D885F|nr:acid phosphatase type 7-like isoform X2 [Hyposmocoma kahamanoa]